MENVSAGLLKKFRKFCKSLSTKDNVAILHHEDVDGLCAGTIASRAVEKLCGKKPKISIPFQYGRMAPEGLSALLEKNRINKLICVDLGLDSFPEIVFSAEKFCEILILDHHKIYRDLNSDKTVFLKTQFFSKKEPSSYVASKFSFDLFMKVSDISECDWIACVGILGDMSFKAWKPFFRKTEKKRKTSFKELDRIRELIEAVETISPKDFSALAKEFLNANSPKQILSGRFMKHLKKFEKEISFFEKDFEKNSESFPEIELIYYEIEPKFDVKSALINRVSQKNPSKTIILMQKRNGMGNFSARRQDFKVKMNELLENAVKGISNGSAGGHIPAAAGRIPLNSISKFKKNLMGFLSAKQG